MTNTLNLAVAIVTRGRGTDAAEVYHDYHSAMTSVMHGHGTASSDIMDMLGLDEPEKSILLGVVQRKNVPLLLAGLSAKMNFGRPGGGIAFTLPLSGVSRLVSELSGRTENEEAGENREEEIRMNDERQYELIVTEVDNGCADLVVEAAKSAGVHGGTVTRTREIADSEKKFFGITIQPEKEVVFMIVPAEIRQTAMKAIIAAVFEKTGETAMTFSLPVLDVAGLKKASAGIPAEEEKEEETKAEETAADQPKKEPEAETSEADEPKADESKAEEAKADETEADEPAKDTSNAEETKSE